MTIAPFEVFYDKYFRMSMNARDLYEALCVKNFNGLSFEEWWECVKSYKLEENSYKETEDGIIVTMHTAQMICRVWNGHIAKKHDCFVPIMMGYLVSDAVEASDHIGTGESMMAYLQSIPHRNHKGETE